MRLALIGDIHHYHLLVPPWRLINKRFLGQVHLWARRRFKFDKKLLEPVVARLCELRPDLVLGTGDLTTTALDGEFAEVARLLSPLVRAAPVLMVPGNHDRYTFRAARRRVMEKHLGAIVPPHFPHLRELHRAWHLLALDAACPRVLTARGRLGRRQLEAALGLLATLPPGQGLVVLCHYPLALPPGVRDRPGHRLLDAWHLRDLLRSWAGPVLYLHGHVHRPWCRRLEEEGLPHVLDINAGAPCMTDADHPLGQGFSMVELPDHAAAPVRLVRHVPRRAADGTIQWSAEAVL